MTAGYESTHAARAFLEEKRRTAGWAMVLRGVVAVIFGIIAVSDPRIAAGAFVIVFAVFAFADAILELFAASAFGRMGLRWGWYAVAALVSIAAGIVALAYPRETFVVLVLLVAIRAIINGGLELGAAIAWRDLESRGWLGLAGVLSIVLGILLFVSPSVGGLALVWTVGIYAIVFGVMMFITGARMAASHGAPTTGHAAAA
jgi:uncharacterized membrane protein HdeD (DUF308 family)